MNNILKKTASVLITFLIGCIILSGMGCKKEPGLTITENNSTVSQAAPAQAQSVPVTFSSNSKIDINFSVFIPCANGGAGETVILSGPLHVLTSFTISDNYIRGRDHFQPQGISGIGDITGAKYQATGITEDEFKGSLINGQFQTTSVNNFRIIGQGPGNNFLVHSIFHVTINADGVLTSFVNSFSIECK